MTKISLSLISIDGCGDVRLTGARPGLRRTMDGLSWRTDPPFFFCLGPLASPPHDSVVLKVRGAASSLTPGLLTPASGPQRAGVLRHSRFTTSACLPTLPFFSHFPFKLCSHFLHPHGFQAICKVCICYQKYTFYRDSSIKIF